MSSHTHDLVRPLQKTLRRAQQSGPSGDKGSDDPAGGEGSSPSSARGIPRLAFSRQDLEPAEIEALQTGLFLSSLCRKETASPLTSLRQNICMALLVENLQKDRKIAKLEAEIVQLREKLTSNDPHYGMESAQNQGESAFWKSWVHIEMHTYVAVE